MASTPVPVRIYGYVGKVGTEEILGDVAVSFGEGDSSVSVTSDSTSGLFDITVAGLARGYDLTFDLLGYVQDICTVVPVTHDVTTIRFSKKLTPVSRNDFDTQFIFDATTVADTSTSVIATLQGVNPPSPVVVMNYDYASGAFSFDITMLMSALGSLKIDINQLFDHMFSKMGAMPDPEPH